MTTYLEHPFQYRDGSFVYDSPGTITKAFLSEGKATLRSHEKCVCCPAVDVRVAG